MNYSHSQAQKNEIDVVTQVHRETPCFSYSLQALKNIIKLLVYCWNRRQLFHRAYPTYSRPLIDFLRPFEF
jgi:hypothetical protein